MSSEPVTEMPYVDRPEVQEICADQLVAGLEQQGVLRRIAASTTSKQ